MLVDYKLYINARGRYVSLELDTEENVYKAYFVGRNGMHSFISSVKPENEDEMIKKLGLTLASDSDHAKVALFRSCPDLKLGDEDENLFNGQTGLDSTV